ncbi:MAG: ATP-dependent RecD-like DNA helicase [Parachlamydiales bacterium]|nr:ATP-dependent RecD-like DNA helicase [Parachlamydiales bacterium]
MEALFGTIERITFFNSENGFTVARLKQHGKLELTTIVGILPSLNPGETVRCTGNWKQNSQHGPQFEVQECLVEMPSDKDGICKYLESGLIKGIGPVFAKRIVEKFGTDTLTIIDESPKKLLKVEGLGKKKLDSIIDCWDKQKSIRDVMLFLQQFGVSSNYAGKIFKAWGAQSIDKVRENPYHLARDIHGIGFKTADTIAKKMGVPYDSLRRIESGIEHILHELGDDGHVCYPRLELIQVTKDLLVVEEHLVEQALQNLLDDKRVVLQTMQDTDYIYLKVLHICETGIANEITRLNSGGCLLRPVNLEKAIEWVQQKLRIKLATLQQDAVSQALKHKLLVITGGPGTGKSTITKAILAITEKLSSRLLLAAPTGRAAKRMTEITGRHAKTIHSLLEYDFTKHGFRRNRDYPLVGDLIIVDEASMIDTHLMYSLLKALPETARVIFVGDINQLPSVGPGNVLKDIIDSEKIPVAALTQIYRQAAGSKIITNAHAINKGVFPDLDGGANSDFFFLDAQETDEVTSTILDLVKTRLPKRYRFDPISAIQVLCPMKRGPIGTIALNQKLQAALNPSKQGLFLNGAQFLVGDKVMQIRNNYDKEVYNGDIGLIKQIDLANQTLWIDYEGRLIDYDFNDLDEVVLAYAVSIHKYQGSECPCIVMPVHTSHFTMLHRNLIYTGVTRGKKLVVVVGTKKALAIAVKNDHVKKRHTGLCHYLQTNTP